MIKQPKYFYKNSKLHRVNGPAIIAYGPFGNIREKHYYINGLIRKYIGFYDNGKIWEIIYYDGRFYNRLNGPAITVFNKKGEIKQKRYWLHNTEYLSLKELKLAAKVLCIK